MTLLQGIRNLFGVGITQIDDQPIDILEKTMSRANSLEAQIKKAQEEFDSFSSDFELKIAACDKLIEKGNSESEFNKKVLVEKLEKATDDFFINIQPLIMEQQEVKDKGSQLGAEILAKSIEIVSLLSDDEQKQIGETISTWEATGLIKGEEVGSHIKAIVTAIDLIVREDKKELSKADQDEEINKGGEGSKGGKIIGHTKSGKPIYNHFSNKNHKEFSEQDHLDAAKVHDEHFDNSAKEQNEKDALHHGSQQISHKNASIKKWGSELKKSEVGHLLEQDDQLIKAESFAGHYANVILRDGNKILFLKRAGTAKVAPGQYCLPGGHIDEGESIQQAAERELKEESNLECPADNLYIKAKAKCNDGKWCFYLEGYGYKGELALLDGEMSNAAWMTKDEYLDADLFFDLKDHLITMDFPEFDVDKVPTLSKGESDLPEYFFFEGELEKATSFSHRAGTQGEIREYQGKKYKKEGKVWKYMGSHHDKKLPVGEVVAHAENTSAGQLRKISTMHQNQHIRDAAKRELERRKSDKEKKEKPIQATNKPEVAKVEEKPKKKKKPEPLKYNSNPDLSAEHKEIEKRFGKHLNKNYDRAISQYEKKFGHVLSTDSARELSDDYEKNRAELSVAVHEPASQLIKNMYAKMLTEKTPKGKSNLVYFTAGGTGAGKSSGLQGNEKSYHDKAHIVYDTNMNTMSGSVQKIDQALNAGKDVRINFTYRDPIKAFTEGAVPRALRIGRTVPIESHLETHMGSLSTILGLKEKYKGNKKVHIVVTNNDLGQGKAKTSNINFPHSFVKEKEKKYIASELREKLHSINENLKSEGKISESHYKGFKG